MEAEAAPEEGGLSYDEAKDTVLAWLVCVMTLQQAKWVPSFVGRNDVYITNKMGGLIQKNRTNGAHVFLDGDGMRHVDWGSGCSTTHLNFVLNSANFAATCA